MRVCKCGGTIRQHGLTKNREAWTCNECGRYEILEFYGQIKSTHNPEPIEIGDELFANGHQRSTIGNR